MTGDKDIICVTTDTVPGRNIKQVLGLIWGIGVVYSVNGTPVGRGATPDDGRRAAYQDMVNRARSINADAVVGIACDSFVSRDYGTHDREYTIYGTAVVLD